MTAVKNFDTDREVKPPVVFVLSGEEFHAKGQLNWDTITEWTRKREAIGPDFPYVEWVLWFINACLLKADHERFRTVISSENDNPKSASDLDEIATWLIEQYTGNADGRSSESAAGSPKTKPSGSDASSSTASAAAGSPQKKVTRSRASSS